MITCPTCGALIADGSEFCPNCGSRQSAAPERAPVRPAIEPARVTPAYSYTAPDAEASAVMSVGGFTGALLLLRIPVVRFVMMIVWASGGCRNRNLRNLGRAALIWWCVGLVLAAVITALCVMGIIHLAENFDAQPFYDFFDRYLQI